jgi:hypothetical protein
MKPLLIVKPEIPTQTVFSLAPVPIVPKIDLLILDAPP